MLQIPQLWTHRDDYRRMMDISLRKILISNTRKFGEERKTRRTSE
jgi:hypothetical protein